MRAEDLGRIKALYLEVDALNRRALTLISAQEAFQNLAPLFERKGQIAQELEDLSTNQTESHDMKLLTDLELTFEAQRTAAVSEVQLAEQLGLLRQKHEKIGKSYGKKTFSPPPQPGGIDQAV